MKKLPLKLRGSNNGLMKIIPLEVIGSNWLLNYEPNKYFVRKYHTFIVVECNQWNINALEFFRQHGSELRVLELFECNFDPHHADFPKKMFSSLSRVEELRLLLLKGVELTDINLCFPVLKSVDCFLHKDEFKVSVPAMVLNRSSISCNLFADS